VRRRAVCWGGGARGGGGGGRPAARPPPPPMFESRLLDTLSRVHPAVPILIFLPAIALFFAWGLSLTSVPVAIGLFALGYGLWTLFEYWLHRIVFHFEPEDGVGARFHWIIHGVHPDHPHEPL